MTLRGSAGGELAEKAARGTAFIFIGQVVSQAIRLASNLILTRLLLPDAFGLMALVIAVSTGLQLISDVGISQGIIRSPRGEERAYQDSAFTIALIRGVLLALIACALAWPASVIYQRSELLWLLPVIGAQAIVQGAESTKISIAMRNINVRPLVLIDLIAQLVGLAFSVTIAWQTGSVVALLAASTAYAVTRTVISHVLLPGPNNRLQLERKAVADIFAFGSWIFVSTLFFFIGTRYDVFALGRLEGMEVLGVYGIAAMIAAVPQSLADRVSGVILMPAIAERFRNAPEQAAADTERARRVLLPSVAVLFLGAAFTAPAFFALLYRDQYRDAGWMTQLLVLVGWCGFLMEASTKTIAGAYSDSRSVAFANFARLLGTVALATIGFHFYSIVGFVVGNAIGSFGGALVCGAALNRRGVRVVGTDIVASAVFLLLAALGCGAPYFIEEATGWPASLVTLGGVPLIVAPLALWSMRAARTFRASLRAS